MRSELVTFGLGVAAVGLVGITLGCGAQEQPATSAPAPQQQSATEHENGDHEHADHEHGMADHSEIEEAMAKLSPADRQLAEQQKICPVSDEPLGSMGTPIKVTVEGREIFVCCEGCVEELKNDFDKYTAKLEKPPVQQ